MKPRHLILFRAALAATLVSALGVVLAQADSKAGMEFVSEEALAPPDRTARLLFIKRDKEVLQGRIRRLEEKVEVSLPDAPAIQLPRTLETVVSEDGKTIVQYGDEVDQSHPSRTNIFWIGQDGTSVAQLVDYYAEDALVSLSPDGYTVVAGHRLKERARAVVSLYSPVGERLWEVTLGDDRRPSILRLTSGARHVVLATTDRERWLADHRIVFFDRSGNEIFSGDDFGIVQKVVVADEDQHLFVQGYDNYGLIRLSTPAVLWQNRGKLRMTSPQGAKVGPEGKLLFLTLADFRGRPQKKNYRWRLSGMDMANGEERLSVWLPGESPGTRNQVFEEISTDRIQLRTGSKRLIYSRTPD